MSLHITTHDPNGKAIFSSQELIPYHSLPIPIGHLTTLYSTQSFPLNLSTESDISAYTNDRTTLPPKGEICPPNGTSVLLMDIAPGVGGAESVMHRTMTLDVVFMLEGEVECWSDGGEKRVLRKGDCVVQRATMHKWVNVTPEGGWARWICFAQATEGGVRVGGRVLGAEWK